MTTMTKSLKLYSVSQYSIANKKFISDNGVTFNSIDDICEQLQHDNHYHLRIHNNTNYVFFGDIDGYTTGIISFKKILRRFMNERYGLQFNIVKDFKYTKNNKAQSVEFDSIRKSYTIVIGVAGAVDVLDGEFDLQIDIVER